VPDAEHWQVLLHRRAKKELRLLPKHVLRHVWQCIKSLADDPFPDGSVRLGGHSGLYRLRVGDWRIVYQVENPAKIVTIVRIGHRSDVYRRL